MSTGPAAATQNKTLTRAWLENSMSSTPGQCLQPVLGHREKALINYTYPSDEELQSVGVTGLFLGHFLSGTGYQMR